MSLEQNLTAMLRDPLAHLGYTIVCVRIQGTTKKIVDLMLERQDGAPITISDCVKANREAAALLEVENPISGAYTLQVGSPGLDRPLIHLGDYERFQGQVAKVTLHNPLDGRRKMIGVIERVVGETVSLKVTEGSTEEVLSFSFNDIQKAKLVPTFKNSK